MNMSKEFDIALDECIDLIIGGGSIQDCLELYPEHESDLRPLLGTFTEYSSHNVFVPGSVAKLEAKTKLQQRIQDTDTGYLPSMITLLQNIFNKPFIWAPLAVAILVVLICLALGMFSASYDDADDDVTTPVVARTGQLEIRVTDAPAYDISAVYMTISDIQVQRAGTMVSRLESRIEWENVIEGSMSFELLSLRNVEKTLGIKELPVGNYAQINNRINQVLVTVDGTDRLASLSNNMIAVSESFTIRAGKTTILVMDIDAEESVNVRDDGEVSFNPIVTLDIEYETDDDRVDITGEPTSAPTGLPTDETTGEPTDEPSPGSSDTPGYGDNGTDNNVNIDDQDQDDAVDDGEDEDENQDDVEVDDGDDDKNDADQDDDEDIDEDDAEGDEMDGDQDDSDDDDKDEDVDDDDKDKDGDEDEDVDDDDDKDKDGDEDKDKDEDEDEDINDDNDQDDGDSGHGNDDDGSDGGNPGKSKGHEMAMAVSRKGIGGLGN